MNRMPLWCVRSRKQTVNLITLDVATENYTKGIADGRCTAAKIQFECGGSRLVTERILWGIGS